MAESVGVSVIVVAANAAPRLGPLLDSLEEQFGGDEHETIVVDRLSSDGTADVALGHPKVDRLLLASQLDPAAAFEQGVMLAAGELVCLVDADGPPFPERWLPRSVEALAGDVDLVQPDADRGDVPLHGTVCRRTVALRIGVADGGPLADVGARLRDRTAAAGFVVDAAPPTPVHSRPPVDVVTVVVCTDGSRGGALARCLDSIARLDDDKVEVLVIENAPRRRLDAALAGRGVRHVHEPRRGLDNARNRAIEEATGDVVAFVDDDCEVDQGWVRGLRRAFDDPSVTIVTGRVLPASLATPSAAWFEAWFSFDRGPQPDRFTRFDRRQWFPLFPSPLGTGCNMAFHRSTFAKVARFDPALDMGTPVGGGGDLDIFAQFLDAGEVAAYTPEAIVKHHHRSTQRALRRQFFGYGAAQGALCFKYAVVRRPHRQQAVAFFRWRLGQHRHRYRAARAGRDRFPASLVVAEAAGQLAGPFLYVWSRLTRTR